MLAIAVSVRRGNFGKFVQSRFHGRFSIQLTITGQYSLHQTFRNIWRKSLAMIDFLKILKIKLSLVAPFSYQYWPYLILLFCHLGGYTYSLAIEPEIQAVTTPLQDEIEQCLETQDDLGELEQVTQRGGSEKTESFFTK